MGRYERLLFDIDGTLLDFKIAEQQGLEQVLKKYGPDRVQNMIERYKVINSSLWDAYEEGEITKDQITDTRFDRLFKEYEITDEGKAAEDEYRYFLNRIAVLIEGADEVCRYLSSRYELYVVTNGFTETQQMRMEDSGLKPYFNGIFISEEAGSQKPKKEFFDYCFAHMENPDPAKMLIIGDSLRSDIKGGNAAGIPTCWYNPAGLENEINVKVDYEIRSLLDLKSFL